MSSIEAHEELIGTIDVWQLRQMRWPIMRSLARRFVEERELAGYMRALLASGRWTSVRVAPRSAADGTRPHVFDVYGRPAAHA